MFRIIFALVFLFLSAGCFSEINKAAQDGGVGVEDGDIRADSLVDPDGSVKDAGRETPADATRTDAITDAAPAVSDAQVLVQDATIPPPDATSAPDTQQPADAEVQADSGDIPDAAPIADATPPPVPDAARACENDRNCGPRGGICADGTCRVTPAWSVWCWDHNPPDGMPTCHHVDGYSSPDVWRLRDHPDGPPACQGPNPDRFPVAECCRGSREWNNEESPDFRDCERQPDGSSMTWDPYNNN